jgi:predicted ATP-grasp superfamily ATP-dependent carboligase
VLTHGIPQRAANEVELSAALERLPGDEVLVQPYLDGRLAAVCGVAWKGRVICAVHQIARRIWPPYVGISAYAETVPRDEELEEGVSHILASLGWSGIFQLQFLRTDRHAYLIDINPRIYGSLALAVAAGLNLPALWVELLMGGKPTPGSYRIGVRYRSEERDLQAVLRALLTGPRLEGLLALVPRPNTTHAILRADDPLPALASLGKLRSSRLPERRE